MDVHSELKLRLDRNDENYDVRIDIPLDSSEPFPKEKIKTVIAFLCLVICSVITMGSLAFVHERLPDRSYPPLPDIFLDNLPNYSWALTATEVIIVVSGTVTVLLSLFHKHRFIVFRRLFLMLAVLYLMRSITMFVTVLPVANPSYYCSPKVKNATMFTILNRVPQLLSGLGLAINNKHTFCGDYIFSGHTVVLVMAYLMISEYSPLWLWPLHWLSFVLSCLGIALILVARGHYTIDVIIAYYLTTRVFWTYHTLANHATLKAKSPGNLFSRAWWFCIFHYFEGKVNHRLPRQYDWPLPWTR